MALLAPIALGSCVADSVSLRITCNTVPETDCTFTTGGLCYLSGSLNLHQSGASTYLAVLRVTNGLKPREREVPPLSETNGVQISEIEVEIRDSAGKKPTFKTALPNPYTVRATGFIPPGDEGLVGADLLPRAYVSALRDLERSGNGVGTISLSVIARGQTSGKVDVESGEWPWYINIRSVNTDPAVTGPDACVKIDDSVCSLGQDKFSRVCNPALVPETN
jgi:hypothetical protein